MKTIINVECMDQELVITNSPVIASGGVHENFIAFNFCEKWDGFGKTAVFYRNEKERYYSVLDSDDICEIPHEVTDYEGNMYFGVYGEAGEVTRTSNILKYKISKGAMTTLLKPSEEPTPDIYQQLLSAYGQTNEALASEKVARQQADATEKAEREASMNALNSAILAEESARKQADATEKAEREASILAEENARKQADATEKAERQAEIAVERERINQLTRMEEGSTTGDVELMDIRVDANGKAHESAGDAVRSQYVSLNTKIDDNVGQLSSEIAYKTENIYPYLSEAITIDVLKDNDSFRDILINLNNGSETSNSKYVSTSLVSIKSRFFRISFDCIVHCYDENGNWLRATTPLKQGEKRRVYLGDDVKYISLCTEKAILPYNHILIAWTDYIFDFNGENVDYFYYGSGVKTSGAKSIEYEFEYFFIGVPIFGEKDTNVGSDNSLNHVLKGHQEARYSGKSTSSKIVKITIPYWVEDTQTEIKARIGKEFETIACCVYGTSISNVSGEGKYPQRLRALLCNSSSFTVRGTSGGKFTENIKTKILSNTDTFDLIILEGCANDWYFGASIEDMRTAIHDIMEHLTGKATNIVFVIDHNGRDYGDMLLNAQQAINGYTSREYYLKCAEIFASYGVITIDAGMLSGINEFKSEMYVDQIHHSNFGGYVFAKSIYDELIRLGIFKE